MKIPSHIDKPDNRKISLKISILTVSAAGLATLSACSANAAPVTQNTPVSWIQQGAAPAVRPTKPTSGQTTPVASPGTASAQPSATRAPEKVGTDAPARVTPAAAATPVQPTANQSNQTPGAQPLSGLPAPTKSVQKNEGGSVTFEVKWEAEQTSDPSVRFVVTMDTHSVNLDKFDLSTLATLRNDKGLQVSPSTWDAPAGGGHHRAGTLVFPTTLGGTPVIESGTKYVELTIRDVAGVKERVLRWNLEAKS